MDNSLQRRRERPVTVVRRSLRLIPMFWLGELVFDTVEDCCDVVLQMARKGVNDFMGRRLLDVMILLNPRLNAHQRKSLMTILSKAVDQLFWEQSLDPRVMRGLLALACPNQDTLLLFGYLMEVISGLASSIGHPDDFIMPSMTGPDVESSISQSTPSEEVDEEAKIAQILLHHFCVEQSYVQSMPSKVRKAVFGVLTGGVEFPLKLRRGRLEWTPEASPICSITLEPLLSEDGTVAPDVVAVVQRTAAIGSQHAFLYRGQALFAWLGHSHLPRNPDTRSLVKPTDIYRLS